MKSLEKTLDEHHLRIADNILICDNTPHELQQMLQELADESDNRGLPLSKFKTKVMMETNTPIGLYMSTMLRSRTVKAKSTGT